MVEMLKIYLKRIFETAQRGDDREESYYSTLEELITSFVESTGKKKIHITTLPKKTEAGNPDFRIWDGNLHITGYIEAKHPSEKNLDQIETSPQLRRYLKIFPNLILTNFFEFRLYRNGTMIDQVSIARPFVIQKLKTIPAVEKEKEFINLLDKFFSFSLPSITKAKQLAEELAKRTSFLKEQIITEQLKEEHSIGRGNILAFYEAFQKYLIGTLNHNDFADLYAQTITYGLFAARTRATNGFNRKTAYDYIPKTIGILKQVFQFISLGEVPTQMGCLIDDISEVLAVTDVNQILQHFYQEGKGKDPIIHFYETFLQEYNPKIREIRGQYYTPLPVVSYIVNSIHTLLKEQFRQSEGLATAKVTVLDPAAGTLTFLAEASKLAVEEFIAKYGSGGKKEFIREHILKDFYAFELMMAPYAIGHLKMGFILQELGYQLQDRDRFNLFLTNTLEMEELQQTEVPGLSSLSEESHRAGKIKKETPILVIIGNPPYQGNSANPSVIERKISKGGFYCADYNIERITQNGRIKYHVKTIQKEAASNLVIKQKTWVGELIEDYKIVDGQWLGERNPKWLQDDYVKFIRFAQNKIEQNKEGGILGFITNHSYLDNPTFRGMRQSLMNTFDEIYLLDLHGNAKKKEKCPDGSKDENVFDIEQGVAIALFIKRKDPTQKTTVRHAEQWGLREDKYKWLTKNNIKTTKWQEIFPKSDAYLFIPRDERLLSRYEEYLKVTDIFPLNNVGIVTSRDKFVIDFDKDRLLNCIRLFKHHKGSDKELYQGTQTKEGWDIRKAHNNIQNIADSGLGKYILPILYRPFDQRYIFYHDDFIERSRKEVMQHMMKENLGLLTCRQQNKVGFYHAFISENIVESCIVSDKTREISCLFPLYLYPATGDSQSRRSARHNLMIFEKREEYEVKRPNLNSAIVEELTKHYGKKPTPEEIFYYVYAVCYSNIYRTKYTEFLKGDFPRIPFTKDCKLFAAIGKLGQELVELHLLKSKALNQPIAKYQGAGDNRVKQVKYDGKTKRVYINETNYFEGIEKMVWEYQIGGYQTLDKWLKSHKDRVLSGEEQRHYLKIITTIKQTIELQADIDKIYPAIEKSVRKQ